MCVRACVHVACVWCACGGCVVCVWQCVYVCGVCVSACVRVCLCGCVHGICVTISIS